MRTFILSGLTDLFPQSANTTQHFSVANSALNGASTQANRQATYQTAGIASQLYIQIPTNGVTAASTLTFRIGGVNKNQTVSIGSGLTGQFNDTTHTDAVAAADLVSMQLVTGATGTSMSIAGAGILFEATNPATTLTKAAMTGAISETGASLTDYIPFINAGQVTTSENKTQFTMRQSFTVKNLFVRVSANTRTTSTTVGTRKNTANGNLSVSIGSTATGNFEDTTNNDSVVSGDLVNYYLTVGSDTAHSITVQAIDVEVTSANSNFFLQASNGPGAIINTSITSYICVYGRLVGTQTTETNAQLTNKVAFSVSNLLVFVVTNTITATSTARFRKNTANGNQVVSITASTTGSFEDTTNSDTVASGDLINYSLVTGGTGTSLTIDQIGMLGAITTTAKTITGKARIQESVPQTITGKARIQESVPQTITGKARIQETVNQTIAGLARIQEIVLQTITGKARIQEVTTQTVQGKARIQESVEQTITGKSRITQSVNKNIAGVARIEETSSQNITGIARIQAVVNKTITGIARITQSVNQDIVGKSRITDTTTQTIAGIARIQQLVSQTITGLARITQVTNQTITGKARIQKSVNQDITGKAAIKQTTSQDITGVARIQQQVTQIIQGTARIQESVEQTITGVGRIQKSAVQTIAGLARITAQVSQDIVGKARIQEVVEKTIVGKARIQQSITKTITGVARITRVTNQTVTGKARITAIEIHTITGKAAIRQTTTKTITGKARIQEKVVQIILGIARITKLVSQNVTGKARITGRVAQTILGKAAIRKTVSKEIAGIARINQKHEVAITGKGFVTARSIKTIIGIASIRQTTNRTITGKAMIIKPMYVITDYPPPFALETAQTRADESSYFTSSVNDAAVKTIEEATFTDAN